MKSKAWQFVLALCAAITLHLCTGHDLCGQFRPGVGAIVELDAIPASNRLPTLRDVILAKLDTVEGTHKLIVMLEPPPGGPTFVTRIREVKRTRKVKGPDGIARDQEYTVQVPFTEAIDLPKSGGRKPVVMDAKDFQFFDLEGKVISIAEVAKRHAKLRPLFLLERFSGEPQSLPDLYRQVLVEDTVIATTKLQVRTISGDRATIPAIPLRRAAEIPQIKN